jgi:hypothetical protein
MAHTYKHNKTNFVCNADLSGEVDIHTESGHITVKGTDLIAFVAGYVRRERIATLENSTDEDILGIS